MILPFSESKRSSIGVEWELQLVDKDSNDLRQVADTVIETAWKDPSLKHRVHRELMLNTVEVTSGARDSVSDCLEDLSQAVTKLRPITNELRIDLATAGTHPFARPTYQRVTDTRRYADLIERTQYWGRQMLLYGVHVHVGVEDREKVLPLVNALITRAGQLQSLASSSPFWVGQNTSYATNRAMVFKQLPTAGIPPQFHSWDELECHYQGMKKTGIVQGFDELRWDVRPSPHLGTVEVRIFDACTNIFEVEAMASLTHAMVEHYSTMYDAGEKLPTMPAWFIDENKWRSARYGMDAILILDEDGNEQPVRETLGAMVAELLPTARRLGCERGLKNVLHILEVGASYERQRAVAEADPKYSLDAVVELMRAEMGADRPLTLEEFEAIRATDRTHLGAGRRI